MNLEGHYIYCHFNPLTDEPFYVGKGSTIDRPWEMKKSRGTIHKNYVAKHGVRVEIIIDGLASNEIANFWEVRWIKALKEAGYDIKNLTAGGDGLTSEVAKEINNRPEVKEKNRAAQLNPDIRDKKIKSAKKTWENKSNNQKILEQELRTLKTKEAHARPDVKEKVIAAQGSPEMRLLKSNNTKKQFASMTAEQRSEFAKKRDAKMSPEARSLRSKKGAETKKINGTDKAKPEDTAIRAASLSATLNKLTPEERSRRAHKIWESRRRNKLLKDK